MSKKANFFAIGVFVSVAALMALAAIIIFGSGAFNKETYPMMATFQGSTNGLRVGAKVKAYGVEVGSVEQVLLHRIDETGEVCIPVIFNLDMDLLKSLLGVDFGEDEYEERMRQFVSGGAVAELQMASMVTGLLYVQLHFDKDRDEGFQINDERFAEYISVPTVSGELAVAMESLIALANNVGSADVSTLIDEVTLVIKDARAAIQAAQIDRLSASANAFLSEGRNALAKPAVQQGLDDFGKTMANLEQFSGKLNTESDAAFESLGNIAEKLDGLIGELETVASNANEWLDPEGVVYYETTETLENVSDSARALKELLEYLERNPNALLTGKGKESSK
ncbi:MlaD family protein [Pelagicoccus mobilis]|uniref:MCE family protein n=1 Tax=Pelagicoccus mobilis TaxID=415221 RepID=A0A934VSY8_9BACT|nr:MlaD family protein [Pelagicoccus mobilis]MBK1879143.1 MCE family protein [Pelagicoccus mobilis]